MAGEEECRAAQASDQVDTGASAEAVAGAGGAAAGTEPLADAGGSAAPAETAGATASAASATPAGASSLPIGEGIAVGRLVEVVGTDMNGSVGEVEEWLEAKGRWRVRFYSMAKNFKATSLRLAPPRKEHLKNKRKATEDARKGAGEDARPAKKAQPQADSVNAPAPFGKPSVDSSVSGIMERLRSSSSLSDCITVTVEAPPPKASVPQPAQSATGNGGAGTAAAEAAVPAPAPAMEATPSSVNLAGKEFANKAELMELVKKLQAKYDADEKGHIPMPSEDVFLLYHLMMRYPGFESKLTAPVVGLRYGIHPNFPTTKCFNIVFEDGREEPVSVAKCAKEIFTPGKQSKNKASVPAEGEPAAKRPRQEVVLEFMEPERSRTEVGLKLIREDAAASRSPHAARWEYPIMDEQYRCFAGYMRCPFSEDVVQDFFRQAKEGTKWESPVDPRSGEPIPRKTAWMVAGPCTCTYRYGGVDVDPQVFPPWMVGLMEHYMPLCGLESKESWPNSCNLNLYEDGTMSVGWHADDEKLFQGRFKDIRIISISFGETRTFEFRTIDTEEDGERPKHRISLHNGDICTMEGLTQKYYHHRVPKEGATAPRINLTFRWVTKHRLDCPAS